MRMVVSKCECCVPGGGAVINAAHGFQTHVRGQKVALRSKMYLQPV